MLLSAVVLLVTASTLAAIVALAATSALTGSMGASIATAVGAGGFVGWLLRHHPVLRPSEPPARGVRVLSIAACLAVLVQLVRLTVFIEDANRPRWSVAPWNAWILGHSCVTAYWVSGREVRAMPDLYADASAPRTEPGARPAPRKLGPLYLDVYEYPPTFLLLPRVLMRAAPDFFDFRRLWYALNVAVVVIGLVAIARRLEGPAGPGLLWLSAVVLAPPAIMTTLQIGNVQLACVALAMLAMLAMEDDAPPVVLALGALGLAFATVSKLYPGVLVVYLLARRRWRAFGCTVAWGVLLGLIGLADLGIAPHRAFLEHLPRLLSGEAFAALANPRGVSGNMSVPGLVFKLGVVYGIPGMSYTAARVVGWEPAAWLAILIAATLRSPLLPPYGAFPPLWLAVVFLAAHWNEPRARLVAIAMVLVFTPVNASQTLLPPSVHAIVTTVQTVVALALVLMALRLGAVAPRPRSF
jgi:hypothetical protein